MKVVATKRGYYGLEIREPGDEFSIPDEPKIKGKPAAFSERWMEAKEEEEVKVEKKAKVGK